MDRLCYLYEQVSVPADKKFKDRSVCVLCVCMHVFCVCVCVPLRAREPVRRLYLGVNWDLEGCALRGFWLCPSLSLSFHPHPSLPPIFSLIQSLVQNASYEFATISYGTASLSSLTGFPYSKHCATV